MVRQRAEILIENRNMHKAALFHDRQDMLQHIVGWQYESSNHHGCWPCSAIQVRYVAIWVTPQTYCLYLAALMLHS
jgi:hypothetical protein